MYYLLSVLGGFILGVLTVNFWPRISGRVKEISQG